MQVVHGDYVITRCGGVVLTKAYGPWNVECVERYILDYRGRAAPLYGEKWADIVTVFGESLMVPDAESLLFERVKAVSQMGLTHLAVVLAYSYAKTTTEMQLSELYNLAGVKCGFFDDYENARAWLITLGYHIDEEYERLHLFEGK